MHLAGERASCAADWRLFSPASWDDQALADPVPAAGARRRRQLSRIPDAVRHAEKWRLALEMIEEMTGPGGWAVLDQVIAAGGRPVVVADIGNGDNALFREGLTAVGLRYVVAVKGSPRAHRLRPSRRPGPTASSASRPARLPGPARELGELAIASAARSAR